MDKSHMNS